MAAAGIDYYMNRATPLINIALGIIGAVASMNKRNAPDAGKVARRYFQLFMVILETETGEQYTPEEVLDFFSVLADRMGYPLSFTFDEDADDLGPGERPVFGLSVGSQFNWEEPL